MESYVGHRVQGPIITVRKTEELLGIIVWLRYRTSPPFGTYFRSKMFEACMLYLERNMKTIVWPRNNTFPTVCHTFPLLISKKCSEFNGNQYNLDQFELSALFGFSDFSIFTRCSCQTG